MLAKHFGLDPWAIGRTWTYDQMHLAHRHMIDEADAMNRDMQKARENSGGKNSRSMSGEQCLAAFPFGAKGPVRKRKPLLLGGKS